MSGGGRRAEARLSAERLGRAHVTASQPERAQHQPDQLGRSLASPAVPALRPRSEGADPRRRDPRHPLLLISPAVPRRVPQQPLRLLGGPRAVRPLYAPA